MSSQIHTPISQGLSKIYNESDSPKFVTFEDSSKPNPSPINPTVKSLKRRPKLHRKNLPCCDFLTDRVYCSILPVTIFILILLDIAAFFLLSWAGTFSDKSGHYLVSCLTKTIGIALDTPPISQIASSAWISSNIVVSITYKNFFYLALISINTFPMEYRRRRSKIRILSILGVVLLLLTSLMSVGLESVFLVFGSVCYSNYNSNYKQNEFKFDWLLYYNCLDNALRTNTTILICKPWTGGITNTTINSIDFNANSRDEFIFSPTIDLSSPGIVPASTSSSTSFFSYPIKMLSNMDKFLPSLNLLNQVSQINEANYSPINARLFIYEWIETWLILKFIFMSIFILVGASTLFFLIIHFFCGLNLSYERFRRWRLRRYTKKLLKFQEDDSNTLMGQSFRQIDNLSIQNTKSFQELESYSDSDEEIKNGLPKGNFKEKIQETSNDYNNNNQEYSYNNEIKFSQGSNLENFNSASEPNEQNYIRQEEEFNNMDQNSIFTLDPPPKNSESQGIIGYIKGFFTEAKSISKKKKKHELILKGHKIGILDLLPPIKMLQSNVGGWIILIFLITIFTCLVFFIVSTVNDLIRLLIAFFCNDDEDTVCVIVNLFANVIQYFKISLFIAAALTPITSLTLCIISYLNFRKNLILHRKGLFHLSSISRRGFNLYDGANYIFVQSSHYAIGGWTQYAGIHISIFAVISLVSLFFFTAAAIYIQKNNITNAVATLFLRIYQFLLTKIITIVLPLLISLPFVWLLKRNINNYKFKNFNVYTVYELIKIPQNLIVSPLKTFFKSLIFKFLIDIISFQRIDIVTSSSFSTFKSFFFHELYYGSPILNTLALSIYRDCIIMEKEYENCFDYSQREKLRLKNRLRMSRFYLGAMLSKNTELISSRTRNYTEQKTILSIVKKRMQNLKPFNRKSTYQPPKM